MIHKIFHKIRIEFSVKLIYINKNVKWIVICTVYDKILIIFFLNQLTLTFLKSYFHSFKQTCKKNKQKYI